MSDEERRDSLADQAAAWVPPWERPRRAAPTTAAPADPSEADESSEADVERDSPPAAVAADTVPPVAAEDRGSTPPVQEPESSTESAESAGSTESAESVGSAESAESAGVAESAEPREAVGVAEAGAAQVGEGAAGVPRREIVGRRRVTAAPEPAPDLPDAELRGALEAILLVVDEPVSELVLAQVLEQPAERIGPMLDEIAAGYTAAGHGFELRRAAGGWRLYTRPEYATYVERFVLDGQSVRLTQAALETLAVVAYKQPVTRSRISAIRGVNCDGVIRTLLTRGLVEECGAEPDSGAFLYRTTTLFLEKLGLNTVDELPPLAPFLPDDVEELADATR
ncbi:SMC-Scp complex subunit ScpB [Micromonospora sp. MH99]|uniref:SMC-Scp complex subunit ScpB n=1 Tax=Micromonospora sp. MH99 TaxID=1945510 RepID=UPI001F0C695E|nr:SMC-Scp complex subunit ScpB [Micromonospora sp. MH99]MCF0091958.1 Segregation and condensation protein B [Micromonospora sp. MH99]